MKALGFGFLAGFCWESLLKTLLRGAGLSSGVPGFRFTVEVLGPLARPGLKATVKPKPYSRSQKVGTSFSSCP